MLDISVNSKDLKIEVLSNKSVWVCKPDTEVRITYLPTGFAVKCNATRSQHQNKAIAMQYIQRYVNSLTRPIAKNDVVTEYHLSKIREARARYYNAN